MKQLDKAFNITPEVVPEEPKPVVKEKPDRLTKNDVEKDYDYTRGIFIVLSKKVKKQLMVYSNLLKKLSNQEHMKLLVS